MENLTYNLGDIIWCNRLYFGAVMEEGHQEGPYIVIKTDNDFIYAVPGRSYKPSRDDYTLRDNILINRSHDKLKRNTVFDLSKVVRMLHSKVINYIGKLSDQEKNELMRKLIMQDNMNNLKGYSTEELVPLVQLELGDVIEKDGKKYFVVCGKKDNIAQVIPYKYNVEGIPKFNFYKMTEFKFDESCKLTYAHTEEFIKMVQFKRFIHECHKPENDCEGITRGSIIFYDGNLYFVSNYNSREYICNKLEITLNVRNTLKMLGFHFNIEKDFTTIQKNEETIHLLYNLTQKKIKAVEIQKNAGSKASSSNSKINLFGRILSLKNTYQSRYGLYKIIDKGYGLFVDLDQLKNGKFVTRELSFQQIYRFGSTKTDFKLFINSINIKIEDPRYEEFLKINGIYGNIDYVSKQHARSRF